MKPSVLDISNMALDESFSQSQHCLSEDYSEGSNFWLNASTFRESIGGILVFSDENQLLYECDIARRILSQLHDNEPSIPTIPNEITHICTSLIQIRLSFPDQSWLAEFDIFTSSATAIHIRSRWLTIEGSVNPYLLLNVEDRKQAVVNIVLREADRYGLTPREKDVWVLQHNNYTYKQIAAELGITPNTVKKHVRSIYSKKKKYS